MKMVAKLIEERRDDELEYVKAWIKELGGDGLYCPDEPCGCGFDDFIPCGQCLEDLECVPAKRGKGEYEGKQDVDLYFPIDDNQVEAGGEAGAEASGNVPVSAKSDKLTAPPADIEEVKPPYTGGAGGLHFH